MVKFQKNSCDFCAAARRTAKRQDVVELGATDLKRAFGSGRPWESKVMYCSPWAKWIVLYKSQISYFKNCMANCMRNFQSHGFPHNFSPKLSPAAETRCIDAFRRQLGVLQSVIKFGSTINFRRKYGDLNSTITIIAGLSTKTPEKFRCTI
jgi:hypothetical protein